MLIAILIACFSSLYEDVKRATLAMTEVMISGSQESLLVITTAAPPFKVPSIAELWVQRLVRSYHETADEDRLVYKNEE